MLIKRNILSLLIALSLVFAVSCSNLDNPVGDLTDMNLKTETKWSVDIETENKINQVHYKEYDINGNILLNISYFENGQINNKSVFEYISKDTSIEAKITYDTSGNVLREITTNYIYNENGKIKKSILFNESGEISNIFVYEYDNQGNLTKKTGTMNSDSTNTVEYSYRYNSSGNVIERVLNDFGTSHTKVRDSVIYSSNNQINIFKYKNNHLSSVTSYLYNNNGLIYKEIVSDSEGVITAKYLYEYTFY